MGYMGILLEYTKAIFYLLKGHDSSLLSLQGLGFGD